MNKHNIIEDSKLVMEYQSGNQKALTVLVERWHKKFCEKAFWIVKDADLAKDIAQDSWRTIIKNIECLEKPESFASWSLRIVCSKSFDVLRAAKRKENALHDFKQEQESISEDEKDNEQVKEALIKTMKQLPANQQLVIKLFYVEDYSLKEISQLLKISNGTVKSRLFHAREKLKKILKNKNYEN